MNETQKQAWNRKLETLMIRRDRVYSAGKPEDRKLEREIRFTQHKLGLI